MSKNTITSTHYNLINSLSSKIAQIYNSDNLGNDLKHDVVCRLIAKNIGANSASLLLYRGTSDNLFCAGKYIDPDYSEAVSTSGLYGESLITVMKRIEILEYIKINKIQVDSEELGQYFVYKQYKDFCNFEFSNPIKISKKEFADFMGYYSEFKKIINKHYETYQTHIRNDAHAISLTEPISGSYYYALTHSETVNDFKLILSSFQDIEANNDKFIVTDLNKFSGKNICADNLFKNLGVKISSNALYVGIPLWANNRPIGILRLLLKRKNSFYLPSDDEGEPSLHRFHFEEESQVLEYVKETISIETISLLISLFVENLYFAEGMRDISLKDALKGDINNLPGIADELTKVVNCHGCMIRQSDPKGGNCSITGFSEGLAPYESMVRRDDPFMTTDRKFLPVLIDLLYKDKKFKDDDEHEQERRIECLKIDFNGEGYPTFSILYLDKNSRLVSTTLDKVLNYGQRKEITNNFHIKEKIFRDFDFHSIILIPIKDQEYGFVSFANKSNRDFITKDVEMLIPVVTRLGLALKYDSAIAKANAASVEQIQQSQRVIYHQLLSPINTIDFWLENLKYIGSKNDFSDFATVVNEISSLVNTTRDYITLNSYLATFLIYKRVNLKPQRVILYNFLTEKVQSYRSYAKNHRNLSIVIFEEDKIKNVPALYTDTSLLSHIIQALLDNAIKYSYSHLERNAFANSLNPLYPPPNSKARKYILVTVKYSAEIVTISIENWGCKIKDSDKKGILEYMKRGEDSDDFEVNGTGIGLFLANILAGALNGELTIDAQGEHTTMHLNLRIKK